MNPKYLRDNERASVDPAQYAAAVAGRGGSSTPTGNFITLNPSVVPNATTTVALPRGENTFWNRNKKGIIISGSILGASAILFFALRKTKRKRKPSSKRKKRK